MESSFNDQEEKEEIERERERERERELYRTIWKVSIGNPKTKSFLQILRDA